MPNPLSRTRSRRASCRVGCVLAVLLVTAGGLRLLAAAESSPGAGTPMGTPPLPVDVAAVMTSPARALGTGPAVHERTTADFVATVEHAARSVECDPEACGYPRMVTAFAWRVPSVSAVRAAADRSPGRPASWIPQDACGLECAERLRAPDALALSF